MARLSIKNLCLVTVATYLSAMVAIVAVGMNDQVGEADVIVVPGNTVSPNGKPSARLQARLDAALKLYRARCAPIIFVSGGTGDEGFDEALSMFTYLTENGVPPTAIIRDHQGVDTEATATNVAMYMQTMNLQTVLVATQYFHIARTKLALERHHVQVRGNLHARFFEMRDLYSIAREVVGYVAYMAHGDAETTRQGQTGNIGS